MEALALLKGSGRTKGPQNWTPDLIGVTAIENTVVATSSKLSSSPRNQEKRCLIFLTFLRCLFLGFCYIVGIITCACAEVPTVLKANLFSSVSVF